MQERLKVGNLHDVFVIEDHSPTLLYLAGDANADFSPESLKQGAEGGRIALDRALK
jgi:hypothetical protein